MSDELGHPRHPFTLSPYLNKQNDFIFSSNNISKINKNMKTLWKTGFFFGSVVITISIVIFVQRLPAGGERNMEETKTGQKVEIPLIDRRIPAQLETATFALG